jgi:hypothetical protein
MVMEDDQELIASLKANQAHDRRLFAAIMKAVKQGNVAALPALLSTEPHDDEQWHFCGRVAAAIGRRGTVHPTVRERLVAFWVNYGEDLRAELSRAEAIRFTKAVFEPYRGKALTLFRGENQQWARQAPSISWTSDLDVARAFAGRNAQHHRSGGVVLTAWVPAERIIADLAAHGYADEGEYLVDTRRLRPSVLEYAEPRLQTQ